ncbi:hypothetical protein KI387_005059, partial [Taxus chinensis]
LLAYKPSWRRSRRSWQDAWLPSRHPQPLITCLLCLFRLLPRQVSINFPLCPSQRRIM